MSSPSVQCESCAAALLQERMQARMLKNIYDRLWQFLCCCCLPNEGAPIETNPLASLRSKCLRSRRKGFVEVDSDDGYESQSDVGVRDEAQGRELRFGI